MKNQTKNRFNTFALVLIFGVIQIGNAQNAKMMPKDGSTVKMSKYSFGETVEILKGVIEKPNGKVIVRYFKPSKVLNDYSGEEAISNELDSLVNIIINEITN